MCTSIYVKLAWFVSTLGTALPLRIHVADNRDTDPEAPTTHLAQITTSLHSLSRSSSGSALRYRIEGRHLPEPRSGNTTRD